MKYLKIAIVLIVLSTISFFYLYIPSTIKVSTFKLSASHELSVLRLINDQKKLVESMSSYYDSNAHNINVNGIQFTVSAALSNLVQIDIISKDIKTKSYISVNSLNRDSAAINWFFEIPTTFNPLKRLSDYQEAIKIKKATEQLLISINNYVEHPINVYGYDIKEVTLSDTLLITTKFISKQLPTNTQVYNAVDGLNKYLGSFNRKRLNNPMVTVLENPTNDYTIMVGISIDGEVKETDNYRIKRMPVNGKMFVADIKGGFSNIQNGYSALKTYLLDAKRPSPAVPFELLLNDRRKVADSSQWLTRIYYPVM